MFIYGGIKEKKMSRDDYCYYPYSAYGEDMKKKCL